MKRFRVYGTQAREIPALPGDEKEHVAVVDWAFIVEGSKVDCVTPCKDMKHTATKDGADRVFHEARVRLFPGEKCKILIGEPPVVDEWEMAFDGAKLHLKLAKQSKSPLVPS